MLEAVVNVSEGSDVSVIQALAEACGPSMLDIHSDRHHNRSVFTLASRSVEQDVRRLAAKAVDLIDISRHVGVHPRIGAVDVVPFVPLPGTNATFEDAERARDDFGRWFSEQHGVPTFLYGNERTLPEIRKHAFVDLAADHGPDTPHPTAGATAVGVREVLVAYNLWLDSNDLGLARAIAKSMRRSGLRTLGLLVGDRAQVSCNLIDPLVVGPDVAYDLVAEQAPVTGAELVGLVPEAIVDLLPPERLDELGLSPSKTIEARIRASMRGRNEVG